MARGGGTIGIIGGSGMLGSAISMALLAHGVVEPGSFWIANRHGATTGFADWPGIKFTTANQELVDACDVVILSVPPAAAGDLDISADDRLVISVMAGVSVTELMALTRARRVIRAMCSPAAARGLAHSPFFAGPGVTAGDRAKARAIFEACGITDEVAEESQIEYFTAMTGPVPGFVAYFADRMIAYATARGIAPEVAERAIRQLFHASGVEMATSRGSPSDHVQFMIDYAGTTAAGLNAMKASPLAEAIADGLDAAVEATRRMRPRSG